MVGRCSSGYSKALSGAAAQALQRPCPAVACIPPLGGVARRGGMCTGALDDAFDSFKKLHHLAVTRMLLRKLLVAEASHIVTPCSPGTSTLNRHAQRQAGTIVQARALARQHQGALVHAHQHPPHTALHPQCRAH